MIIDCNECLMLGTDTCRDCVVTSLLRIDSDPVQLRAEEQVALDNLADTLARLLATGETPHPGDHE